MIDTDRRTPFDARTPTIVVVPTVSGEDWSVREEEAVGLAEAIALDVKRVIAAPIRKPDPARLFGGGKIQELAEAVEEENATLISVDAALSPVQHRNLERALNVKVLDRTGLILEIFGARARTREGRLQTDLAHLKYQRSRLVRSWTHLERQRGGAGFMGGPGETQIEADRRILAEKIARLERRLRDVKRTRRVQRAGRSRSERAVAALVGYTNAGKSTLFNRLADAGVEAKDQVFQTLDPTLRVVRTVSGRALVLADTVGFIADLPTLLVDAFHATLEEAASADVLIHVRDVSAPDFHRQGEAVRETLAHLGVDEEDPRPVLEVWNKVDLLPGDERAKLLNDRSRRRDDPSTIARPRVVPVSAASGVGIEDLLAALDEVLSSNAAEGLVIAPHALGGLETWLRERGALRRADYQDEAARYAVTLSRADLGRLRHAFPEARFVGAAAAPDTLAAE